MSKSKSINYTITLFCCCVLNFLHRVNTQHEEDTQIVKHDQNPLEDWSILCTRNAILNNFLTLGMGQSDVLTILVSQMTQLIPNCTVVLTTSLGADLIISIELPDNIHKRKLIDCNKTRIIISTGIAPDVDACKKMNLRSHRHHTSVATSSHQVFVRMSGNGYFETTKLTATTVRPTKDGDCDDRLEVKCERIDYDQYASYCMTVDVACDGHLNCGFKDKFDEDVKLCEDQSPALYYIIVAVIVIAIGAIAMFFFLRLLRVKIPRVGTNFFVFNEDEDNRLNLTSVFANPLTNSGPQAKRSLASHSSSYYFRTTPIPATPEDGLVEGKRSRERGATTKDSEVELRSDVLGHPRSRLQAHDRRNMNTPLVEERKPTRETTSQETKDKKKTHFHIAPAAVEIIPDFITDRPLHDNVAEKESPRKSILGHTHDNKPFPRFDQGAGTSKNIQIVKKRKKNSLSKVRSSKDLIIRKIHTRDQADDGGPKPRDTD